MRGATIIAFLSFLVLGTAAAKVAVGQQTALPLSGQKPPGPTDDFSLAHLRYQLRYRWQIAASLRSVRGLSASGFPPHQRG